MTTRPVADGRVAAAVIAAALVLAALPLQAHEIGTTRVTMSLQPSNSYRVEIVTDAKALVDKLRHVDGLGPADSAADLGRELDARGHVLATRLALAADEHPMRSSLAGPSLLPRL